MQKYFQDQLFTDNGNYIFLKLRGIPYIFSTESCFIKDAGLKQGF